MFSFVFCFLLIKRYKDRFFHTALKPQTHRLLSDILGPATAAEQQVGVPSPYRRYHGLACMLCMLNCWLKMGNMKLLLTTQHHHRLLFTSQSQLSQITNSHLTFGRPMKAAFLLSHKQHDPISVHLAQA